MHVFLEQVVNGLTLASMYALVAAGFALIVGVVRIVNFAHGEFFMVGSYLLYGLCKVLGIPFFPSLALTVVIMMVFGIVFERIIVRTIADRSWDVQLLATLAASVILSNGARVVLGSTPRTVDTLYSKSVVEVAGFRLSWQRIIALVVAIVVFALLHLFLQRTKMGKAMRAVSQNREACDVFGLNVNLIYLVTFAIGAGLAGLGASLVAPLYNVVPTMGTMMTLKAFAIVVMGGYGRVNGAIFAAIIIGVAEALTAGYLATTYVDAAAYGMMVLVLLLRPQGLFGRKVGI